MMKHPIMISLKTMRWLRKLLRLMHEGAGQAQEPGVETESRIY